MIKFINLGKQFQLNYLLIHMFIILFWPWQRTDYCFSRNGSRGQTLTSQLGGQRSVPVHSMWGLWKKWNCDWFPPKTSVFPYNYHFTDTLQPYFIILHVQYSQFHLCECSSRCYPSL